MDKDSFISSNVHVWLANLRIKDHVFAGPLQYLSLDERMRADQYVHSKDRWDYVSSRGILRDILARYMHCRAVEVAFYYSPNGKPGMGLPGQPAAFEFNLSHSSGLLAVAVTQGVKVGVDIELVRSIPDMDLIATHSFSQWEQNELSVLPSEEKSSGFFRCWTRKEAYLKATGNGLSIPLSSFDVSLEPDNPICMHSNRFDPNEVPRWSFYTFIPVHGFIGALVIESPQVRPSFRIWEPAKDVPD